MFSNFDSLYKTRFGYVSKNGARAFEYSCWGVSIENAPNRTDGICYETSSAPCRRFFIMPVIFTDISANFRALFRTTPRETQPGQMAPNRRKKHRAAKPKNPNARSSSRSELKTIFEHRTAAAFVNGVWGWSRYTSRRRSFYVIFKNVPVREDFFPPPNLYSLPTQNTTAFYRQYGRSSGPAVRVTRARLLPFRARSCRRRRWARAAYFRFHWNRAPGTMAATRARLNFSSSSSSSFHGRQFRFWPNRVDFRNYPNCGRKILFRPALYPQNN